MKRKMGWRPDLPDPRDYIEDHPKVASLLTPLGVRGVSQSLQSSIDNREYCSPVTDQGDLGSCTAHMGVNMVEYCVSLAGGHIRGSRRFVYKCTRDLAGYKGDSGAEIRNTMGALVMFGVPPEKLWPYSDAPDKFDLVPPTHVYIAGQSFQTEKYLRLDFPGVDRELLIHKLKVYLSAKFPIGFGFSVFESIDQAEKQGRIPIPGRRESMEGGHAVMAIGFDDSMDIFNELSLIKSRGAFLIKNSWGSSWGDEGYGWLPYDYVRQHLAEDFWVLLKSEWLETEQFGLRF